MRKSWKLGFLVLVAAVIGLLAACGGTDDGDTDNEANADGDEGYDLNESYTVVSDNSFVPFEFVEDGELVGFDIDLIKAIADEAGFEIEGGEIETTNFDGIIPGLQTGQFEIAIAGMSITEERAQVIDFSDGYYESGIAIAVLADRDDINGLEDLDGKTVATRLGTTSANYLKEHVPGAQVNEYEQMDQVYLAVENGSADAVMYDLPNIEYYIATAGEGRLKVVGDLYQAEDYGIGITQGNEDLVEAINEALLKLREDGTYDEIYDKWFGDGSEE